MLILLKASKDAGLWTILLKTKDVLIVLFCTKRSIEHPHQALGILQFYTRIKDDTAAEAEMP